MAKELAQQEGADLAVVLPAAWLHDLVPIAKDDPRRAQASQLSASAACEFLERLNYPQKFMPLIKHAIEAHSFSAKITPETLEARVVQDADRLDALGAIGIARVFATAGLLRRPFYSAQDPFCEDREPNDAIFTVDHFYRKLLVISETLQTVSGRREGLRRRHILERYLEDLQKELI